MESGERSIWHRNLPRSAAVAGRGQPPGPPPPAVGSLGG